MLPRPARLAALVLLVAVATGVVTACAAAPEPAPSPLFATEEEAFAAAEEVYRAYNDAQNAERTGEVGEDPMSFLVGTALEARVDAYRRLQQAKSHLVGVTSIVGFARVSARLYEAVGHVRMTVCVDGSDTRLLDESGRDVTPPGRAEVVAFDVEYLTIEGALRIQSTILEPDFQC